MASNAEEIASRCLRPILAGIPTGAAIGDSPEFQRVLSGLEWFLPGILAEIHPEWAGMSMDGVYPAFAHKTGEEEAEIFGLCCLMADQTLTPIHVRFQLSPTTDEISWLELRLGEKRPAGMMRSPYPTSGSLHNRLHALRGRTNTIEWVYQVTFGQRNV
jgi:hypothetical protein